MDDRVIVTRPVIGICHMQVCASLDATEEEILEVANRENPSGTTNGWSRICREGNQAPVACGDDPRRNHFILVC